ncbi:hypothetical protein GLOIN_2v1501247 [Rhizophagus irregularis DAOM 181602=DAOM 197198]|uniref:Uncharacterized protein n=1 Tax=Rhizophagus irregularis (strain DAOM 181602 / DAOM 197198 / MUCL 43194) TaxID=747089 RepID=A0A2P4QWD1_RHIID|nr:hypothetical protein GLOIN_2v1501247 [Rhizophagus irregularis DAOM 181602=DAOM 197198]POG81971.1 hypothetical protein GLOIN_2v1501247 [Rhizophagus irregularis DAOM 181602=DAOM 197198]|eukprot:XP_025188837.1 hypothetical protein GLOIN_2v1501247 [Rhizophagus irregularis DAOM 181602=DAOM 197198]
MKCKKSCLKRDGRKFYKKMEKLNQLWRYSNEPLLISQSPRLPVITNDNQYLVMVKAEMI